jgi:hypothetical protein
MSISLMDWVEAKSTCNQSGYALAVPSFQPPPFIQPLPFRSPLIVPDGANPGPLVDDADAIAPFAADATSTRPVTEVVKLHHPPLSASVTPKLLRARTSHQYVVPELSPLTTAPLPVVLIQPVSQFALLLVSTQYSKLVAPRLEPHDKAMLAG